MMATDPICKMEVDEKSRFKSSYKGKVYLFCSLDCKQSFDKKPEEHTRK